MPVYRSVYLTPGVYRQLPPAENDDIRLVRTDIAGFVGFAERGPLPHPRAAAEELRSAAVRLTSWKQFLTTFGGFMPYSYLAYAVRAFFENGGTTCYVVRVAAVKAATSSLRPNTAFFAVPSVGPDQTGDSLAAPARAGDSELTVVDGSQFGGISAGDLLEITHDGATEYVMVLERDKTSIRLARKLSYKFPEGTALLKYEPGLTVTATSPGNWGNRIKLTITPLTSGDPGEEFALRVTLPPGLDRSRPVEDEFYKRLSTAEGPFFAPDHVNTVSNLITVDVTRTSPPGPPLLIGKGPLASGAVQLQGGRDGLSAVSTGDFIGGDEDLRGLRLVEEIDEVAILCVPDAVFEPPLELSIPDPPFTDPCVSPPETMEPPPASDDETTVPPVSDTLSIYRAMIDQCERLRYRTTILDYPITKEMLSELQKWKSEHFVTRFGAIYYPWLKVPDALQIEGLSRRVPAAGHVAGVYARIDNQFGVGRPPANAALEFVTDVADNVSDLDQQKLNPFGINAIRVFPGRGIRVWGARSLTRDEDTDWRFIHARRLMSMIEKSIEISTRWTVFEPNDFSLRHTLVHSLSVFLEAIWRTGALKGTKPSDGFYVKCDETNNPPAVVDVGRIVCEVGVAIAAPMEFLVFEIHKNPASVEIIET